MTMTVVVTRDVAPRYRGFLASVMLEIAPGVYTSPKMSAGVRERMWGVLCDWYSQLPQGGLVMTWPSRTEPAGQEVVTLGHPPRLLVRHGEQVMSFRELPQDSKDLE